MGAILQIFFNAGEASLRSPTWLESESGARTRDEETGAAWCQAFVVGVERVEVIGRAKPGMRTVLDAVEPSARVLREKGPAGEWKFLSRLLFFLFCSSYIGLLLREGTEGGTERGTT